MPLYEYRCETCGQSEEKLQGISAAQMHDCPNCGAKEGMHRQVSLASFALSGSGWFSSGYGEAKGSIGGESGSSKATADAAAPSPASPKPSEGGGCCGGCACH